MSEPKTILVYVGLDAVGDGLMKLPFLRSLRAAFPHARITWAAGKGHTVFAGILAPVIAGLADEVLDRADFGSKPRELIGATPLAGRDFDLIIDTQRRLLTSLILRRIKHRRFISAAAEFLLSDAKPKAGYLRPPAMVGQLMDLLALACGGPPPEGADLVLDAATLETARSLLPDGAVYVGLAPGAGGLQKCWPLDRFVEIAAQLSASGRIAVFLLGPNEADWAAQIKTGAPAALFPLQQPGIAVTPMLTIALGRRLAAAVANDSGTGHMLAASDVPLVSLFGPTPAEKFAPAARRGRVLRSQDFGTETMGGIPISAVAFALTEALGNC